MTTTNRSFIKAYRHDTAETAPASRVIAGSARSSEVVRVPVTAGSVARGSPDPALVPKKPLSSFISRSGARPITDRPETDFLRPGTTIASFQWPAVCRTLAQQCGRQLDRVTELLVAQAGAGRSLIAVIGLQRGRGATTITLCLAARLAGRGRRIILVDGNFTNPRLAPALEAVPTTGWQEVLLHGAPLADAVIRATDEQLDVLALGAQPPADALRLVAGLQAVVTAGVLRHAYDLVLVDAGAFFDPASQPIVVALMRNMGIDAALAVGGPEPVDPRELATFAENLDRSGCELLGTIENRVAKTQAD